jgi:N-acetylglutamate synthase
MTDRDPIDGLVPGIRAVVRHRIEHGVPGVPGVTGVHGVTDALGELVAITAETVSIRTRRGVEVIERIAVVAAKEIPPKPSRRGAPHMAVSLDDLEQIMVEGWPPVERAALGDWLLRASDGFTGRANSVLPLGNPGMPLSEAVDYAESWYDERGLRRLFCVFGPEGFVVADDPLGRELLKRSYQPFNRTVVLTSAARSLPSDIPSAGKAAGPQMRVEPALSQPWLDAYTDPAWGGHSSAITTPSAARAVLSGSPDQLFASLVSDGAVIGVARVAFAQAWAGLFALRVAPEHRRRGVAGRLTGALADAARARGIRPIYLQVETTNSPALSLFGGLGFSTHHEYCYLGA